MLEFDVDLASFAYVAGMDGPTSMVYGPDGNLYVSEYRTDRVTRFNGTTGAFIDVFVAAGSGGLDGTRELVFGPGGDLYVASERTDTVIRYNGTTGALVGNFVWDDPLTPLTDESGGLDNPDRPRVRRRRRPVRRQLRTRTA